MRIGHDSPYLSTVTVSADRTTRVELSSRFDSELNYVLINERQSDDGVSEHIKAPDDWEPYRVTDPAVLQALPVFNQKTVRDSITDMHDIKNTIVKTSQEMIDIYENILTANPSARSELQPFIDRHTKMIVESTASWDQHIAEFESQWASYLALE